jgi:tRNA G18 (ribose-2'-O)-methylase SpoU
MLTIVPIDDLDRPELAPFVTLRRPHEHRLQGIFVAEGNLVVERLIECRWPTISVLATPVKLERYRAGFETLDPPPVVYLGSPELVDRIVGYPLHQGIMAVARIPEPPPLGAVLAAAGPAPLLVALDGLNNSENVGVVVRNATALGATAILVGEGSASPWLRRAVRNSMGAVFSIPIVPIDDLPTALRSLTNEGGIAVIAADPSSGRPPEQLDLARGICLVLGAEGPGVSAAVLDACPERAGIPMSSGVDSLNVACASAALLAEAARQRRAAGR